MDVCVLRIFYSVDSYNLFGDTLFCYGFLAPLNKRWKMDNFLILIGEAV
jgi:hypothetical protein